MIHKFRFWHKGFKQMFNVAALNFEESLVVVRGIVINKLIVSFPFEDGELIQWSGFADKNGTPMFLGDIINWDGSFYKTTIGELKILHDSDSLNEIRYIVGDVCNFWNEDDLKEMEVIGNKFENPELLEDTDVE